MKRCVIASVLATLITILAVGIVITGIKVIPNPFASKEERVVQKLMGEYVVDEFAFAVEGLLMSSPPADKATLALTKYSVEKDCVRKSFAGNSPYVFGVEEYTCVKIDDQFLENGLDFQGRAMRKLFPLNSTFHETVKEAYAIFIAEPATAETAPEYKDQPVFYYIDGTYYLVESLIAAYKLEKLPPKGLFS